MREKSGRIIEIRKIKKSYSCLLFEQCRIVYLKCLASLHIVPHTSILNPAKLRKATGILCLLKISAITERILSRNLRFGKNTDLPPQQIYPNIIFTIISLLRLQGRKLAFVKKTVSPLILSPDYSLPYFMDEPE